MRLQPTDDPTVAYIKLPTQLLVRNRQEFKQSVLDNVGLRHLIVDGSDCGYIDACGLGALISVNKKLHTKGCQMVLSGLNDDLTVLMELTKIDTLIPIAETTELAMVKLQNTRLPGQKVPALALV